MSDIRFNRWLHGTGSGGVSQDSSGNIGIGTSVPRSSLDVEGFVRVLNGVNASGVITATSFSGSGANLTGVAATSNISTNAIVNSGVTTVAAGSVSAPSITPTGDSNTGIFFPSADTIAFAEGGVEAARIDSSGRLLLGTSSARSNFYSIAPDIQLERAADRARQLIINNINGAQGSELIIAKTRGSSVGSNTVVQSSDELGIIYFAGADGTNLVIGASVKAEVDGTPGTNDMPGRLVFGTTADGANSATERMRLTQRGSLLLNPTGSYLSTSADYHYISHNAVGEQVVYMRHLGSTGNCHGMLIQLENSADNTSSFHLRNYVHGTLKSAFYSNGGLANFSANNANLSDRNAKKDISPAAGTWDCIKEWEIVNYRYKNQPDDANLNLGVIAQQVEESCPEVVTVFEEAKDAKLAVLDDDGNEVEPAQEAQPEKLGVKEQQMMWMAIKALQEAQVRIEQLEARLTAAGID